MDESITIRMSENKSTLATTFSPVINVRGGSEIALVRLQTSNVYAYDKFIKINETNNRMNIENSNLNNNMFYLIEIKIAPGNYLITDINKLIQNKLTENNIYFKSKFDKFSIEKPSQFSLVTNDNGLTCRMYCNWGINLDIENSLASTLGFEKKSYVPNEKTDLYYQSEKINYSTAGSIKVKCNIAKGLVDNGQQSQSIYEFFPQQNLGNKIVESPINLIYYKLNTAVIKKIKIELVDEDNKNINSNQVTVILHIRSITS